MTKRMPDYLNKMIEIYQHIPLFIEHIPLDDFLNDKRNLT